MARRRRINKNGQVDSDDPGDEDEDEEEEEEKRRNGMQSRQNEGEDDDVGNDDAEDEDDVVDDDKDDEKAAILTNLDEYYGKLKEETLHEQRWGKDVASCHQPGWLNAMPNVPSDHPR